MRKLKRFGERKRYTYTTQIYTATATVGGIDEDRLPPGQSRAFIPV